MCVCAGGARAHVCSYVYVSKGDITCQQTAPPHEAECGFSSGFPRHALPLHVCCFFQRGGLKGLDALFKLGPLPLHSLPSCLQLALPILADLQLERSQPAAVLPMGNQTWISCIQSQLGCQAWLNHGCVGIFRRMRPWGGVLSQWTCDVTLSPILWV